MSKKVGVTCPHCSQTFPKDVPEKGGGTTHGSCPKFHKSIKITYKDGVVLEVRK